MKDPTQSRRSGAAVLLLGAVGIAIALVLGCAGSLYGQIAQDYFAAPDPDDPWTPKIEFWQLRERIDAGEDTVPSAASVAVQGSANPGDAGVGDLRVKYESFRGESKRAMARNLAGWIQEQSRQHYRPDGVSDHWATLEETFRDNGDDCDGLELLTYNFLRDLGFQKSEVYRAIVFRRSDGQHHMVTLWFETPDDPWVIDPTGAMTSGMPHMSEVAGWTPLKVFSEDEEFTVRRDIVARRTD
ncbi:MAG: hypothetical protein ACE5FL_08030 [Myxococcota bacterium]